MAPLNQEESFSDEDSRSGIDTVATARDSPRDSSRSISKPATVAKDRAESDPHPPEDAFLYYSNDEVRMKTLRLSDEASIAASANAESSRPERRTRLSFELHPSLILDDMMDELLNDEDALGEIDFDRLENSDDPKMGLLAELFRI
eukprot:CAMPEP_0172536924 /NCGR_PEP_ID=MMETSP1067-20121228/8636_1 /TAXON_ID=265564 ORGANISM="Thalassiosira punctigera, Strain Tpunct2005C2" /NCGR_SAMPLE_ID=MMETSP1067 /ASSEMBLY_ACC=CAM_ASM_000444 /LENGTH=145 /DNA_ID=CAMNT_0013322111 /DNA_START=98 /DNA_END=535 /DNA_ORIENTATION=+